MLRLISLAAVVVAAASARADGPFGFEAGMPLQKLRSLTILTPTPNKVPNMWVTNEAPKSHPAFETYVLSVSPTGGLLKLRAIGKTITADKYGRELQSIFKGLASALDAKYGPGKQVDFLASSSIWRGPSEWIMSLKVGDRTLANFWKPPPGERSLRDKVTTILLEAKGVSSNAGYLVLSYEFEGFEEYMDEKQKKADEAL